MSQSNPTSNANVPVSEVYWSLVAKADKKFSKIRDLPYYERNRSISLSLCSAYGVSVLNKGIISVSAVCTRLFADWIH
ncbi:hypothetical protein HanOQP8_Chr06g0209621 [Helianthus annuus]|nr:hypothetical protein HanOQP8_Chr06g0209621 [Helianthus annuus]